MERMLWSAARRLAFLVVGSLLLVAVPFALDARVGPLPAVCGALALALLGAAVLPLLRAGRGVHELDAGPKIPLVADVYRTPASAPDTDATERVAAHHAAVAFLLLALAGSLVVVAAAAR